MVESGSLIIKYTKPDRLSNMSMLPRSHGAEQDQRHPYGLETSADPGCYLQPAQETIDWYWTIMPHTARDFVLDTPDGFLSLKGLVGFWSSPQNLHFARGELAWKLWRASWHLSFNYLRQGNLREARALLINGAFLHQCQVSTVEAVRRFSRSGDAAEELPYFAAGVSAAQTPAGMQHYLTNGKLASIRQGMAIVDHISDDWARPRRGYGRLRRDGQDVDGGSSIQLIFADDANEDTRHSFDVGSFTTLKALFSEYAEKRGVSLRLLRFSHAGRTLFPSSAGKKTPEELGMTGPENVIKVQDVSSPQVPHIDMKSTALRRGKSKKNARKSRGRGKKRLTRQDAPSKIGKTEEELKHEHSKRLSKLHEELHPHLKGIRQRLNNLVIERSQPKSRSKHRKAKVAAADNLMAAHPCSLAVGGKAGRSHFVVQVGEVENLYKTSKPSTLGSHSSRAKFLLDLHGCARKEALVRLDKNHKDWVDTAMRGSYPFVVEVVIVCGCGGQSLSETVQEWIKSKKNVSNAPKKV